MQAAPKIVRKFALIGIVDEKTITDPNGKSDNSHNGGGQKTPTSGCGCHGVTSVGTWDGIILGRCQLECTCRFITVRLQYKVPGVSWGKVSILGVKRTRLEFAD
jgi:hypothetical protein